MARTVKEWRGKNDDARPHRAVLLRLFTAAKGFCQQCGIKVGLKAWHADHIIRLADGGENRESNLQVLCIACHKGKTVEENKLGARASRIRAKHLGIRKPSRFKRPEGVKFNWAKGRYEREPKP